MTSKLKKLCYLAGRSSIYLGAIVAGAVASEVNRLVVPLLILFAAVILGEYLCYVGGQKGYVYLRIEKGPEGAIATIILTLLSVAMCAAGVFAFLKTRDLSLIAASAFFAVSAVYLIARRSGEKS